MNITGVPPSSIQVSRSQPLRRQDPQARSLTSPEESRSLLNGWKIRAASPSLSWQCSPPTPDIVGSLKTPSVVSEYRRQPGAITLAPSHGSYLSTSSGIAPAPRDGSRTTEYTLPTLSHSRTEFRMPSTHRHLTLISVDMPQRAQVESFAPV